MVFFELIQREEWDTLHALLLENPLSARLSTRDRLARTALHHAIAKRTCPPHIVTPLLDHAQANGTLLAADIGGNCILHTCGFTGNDGVLRVALERLAAAAAPPPAGPAAAVGNAQVVASHRLSRMLCSVNDCGVSPCMLAWAKYFYPSCSLFRKLGDGAKLATRVSETQQMHLMELMNLGGDFADLLQDRPNLANLWNKTRLMAYAMERPDMAYPLGYDFDMLALLIRHGKALQCPTVAVWMALKFHQQQPGRPGSSYLHLAAASRPTLVLPMDDMLLQAWQELDPGQAVLAQQSVLAQLIHWQPQAAAAAAQTTRRDSQGHLPLHIAIERGWHAASDILALINAYPQAMHVCDPVSGLPPVLLAAHSATCPLSTVYEMIKSRPAWILSLRRGRRQQQQADSSSPRAEGSRRSDSDQDDHKKRKLG